MDYLTTTSVRLGRRRGTRRRAGLMVYMMFATPVLVGITMLAVDVGRTDVAQGELQTAADAAARYAAAGMLASSTKSATAYSQAVLACADEVVDGRKVAPTASNVETGIWIGGIRLFVPSTDPYAVNAVRVTLNCVLGGTGSVPLFASLLNQPTRAISATSIATATTVQTTVAPPTSGNLWLAGAPDNTTISDNQNNPTKYDNSGTTANPKQRPLEVSLTSLGLQPGDLVSFEGLAGLGNTGGNVSNFDADGNPNYPVSLGAAPSGAVPSTGADNIANTRAPISAIMAVFLNDNAPSTTAQPAGLDFGSAASRDYTLISPQLKQPFFVGDGKTSAGEVQQIRVPAGATRVFMGAMDAWQWNDNTGTFTMKFYRGTKVCTVK